MLLLDQALDEEAKLLRADLSTDGDLHVHFDFEKVSVPERADICFLLFNLIFLFHYKGVLGFWVCVTR